MVTYNTTRKEEGKGGNNMENKQNSIGRIWSGVSWGLFLILAGVLIFSNNRGWVEEGAGWLYFAAGIGVLFIIGFLVRFFGRGEGWNAVGDLAAGVGIIYIALVILYGFGDWWPLVCVPFGLGFIIQSVWQHNHAAVR
jgi:hypothetical protein